ncbi:MAG TPA: hypothetical protein PLF01_07910, partial [Alphaproteobacteria bacterium]|nr:hypothetical protein [Alphaproteobacteria bacterium]
GSWHKYAMTKLSDFSSEERALIVSLPYRVGIWISNCDDNEKTGRDDKQERKVLELAISRMAKAHRKMPFAAEIMYQVETAKNHWRSWEQAGEEKQVLQDLAKALEICGRSLSKKEMSQYKQAVWNIAMAVAQAFGEHVDPDNEMHVNNFFSWLGSFVVGPRLKKAPENMSMAEKTALKKLRAVLKG